MNALEILGLACVDATFRKRLFADVASVIAANKTDLTWAEEDGLTYITARSLPQPKAHERTEFGADPKGKGGETIDTPNPLPKELADVGEAIAAMCPMDPCPWPENFTQSRPKKTV